MTPPPKKLPQPEMFSVLKRRGGMLAVCTLIVVAMGAYGGASLKTTVEKTQKVQKVREASLEERIYRYDHPFKQYPQTTNIKPVWKTTSIRWSLRSINWKGRLLSFVGERNQIDEERYTKAFAWKMRRINTLSNFQTRFPKQTSPPPPLSLYECTASWIYPTPALLHIHPIAIAIAMLLRPLILPTHRPDHKCLLKLPRLTLEGLNLLVTIQRPRLTVSSSAFLHPGRLNPALEFFFTHLFRRHLTTASLAIFNSPSNSLTFGSSCRRCFNASISALTLFLSSEFFVSCSWDCVFSRSFASNPAIISDSLCSRRFNSAATRDWM